MLPSTETRLDRVEIADGWLRVGFSTGAHADFHLRWLRHNARDDLHPTTGERTRCSSELPSEIRARGAEVASGDLLVRWSDDAAPTRYEAAWLFEHAYAWNRIDARPPSELEPVTIHAEGHGSWQTVVDAALPIVREHGLVVVRGRRSSALSPEHETDAIIDAFGAAGLHTTATHFGRIEDLRTDNSTNANTDQLGYTDAGIELHTDQPFLETPPRYQLLQSIRQATNGGENFFVDAHAAATYLGTLDAVALDLLLSTEVRFHRRQKSFEKIKDGPILTLKPRFFVRLSYFTLAPLRLDFAQTEAFYRAHDRFVSIVRDRRHQRRITLQEGEWVLYDNHRTLHARTGFEGPRWVRGVYFDP